MIEYLAGVSANAGPGSFSADGKWLTFWPLEPDSDLWIVPVDRTAGSLRLGQPHPLLQQTGSKGAPAISPDGRWVAYTSNESGRFEIYVMPFSPHRNGDRRQMGSFQCEEEPIPPGPETPRSCTIKAINCRFTRLSTPSKAIRSWRKRPESGPTTRLGNTGIFQGFRRCARRKARCRVAPGRVTPRPKRWSTFCSTSTRNCAARLRFTKHRSLSDSQFMAQKPQRQRFEPTV